MEVSSAFWHVCDNNITTTAINGGNAKITKCLCLCQCLHSTVLSLTMGTCRTQQNKSQHPVEFGVFVWTFPKCFPSFFITFLLHLLSLGFIRWNMSVQVKHKIVQIQMVISGELLSKMFNEVCVKRTKTHTNAHIHGQTINSKTHLKCCGTGK